MDAVYVNSLGGWSTSSLITATSINLTHINEVLLTGSNYSQSDHALHSEGYAYFAFTPTVTGQYFFQGSIAATFGFFNPNSDATQYKGGNASFRIFDTRNSNASISSFQYSDGNYDSTNASSDVRSLGPVSLLLTGGVTYQIDLNGNSYAGGGGIGFSNHNGFSTNVSLTAVPEPSGILLVCIATIGIRLRCKRRL